MDDRCPGLRWFNKHRVALFVCSALLSGSHAATVFNLAGTGTKGFSGEGGPGTNAQLSFPCGVVRGPDGAVYICDTENHRIRKVGSDGRIVTVIGTGEAGWSGDGGPAKEARINEPYEVRFDRNRNMFWVERASYTVRKLDATSGIVTTIAGNGTAGFSGDGGPATKAQLNEPHSIALDKSGNVYICDIRNHRIRKVDPTTGQISTFAGTGESKPTPDGARFDVAPLNGPRALDVDQSGNLILALREGNQIFRLDLSKRTIHLLAGSGKKGSSGDDGPARDATLGGPKGVSVSPNGDIYFADTENEVIRKIDAKSGMIHRVAGTGSQGDGPVGDALQCRMHRPHGIFVDRDGSILVGDSDANRIRLIRN